MSKYSEVECVPDDDNVTAAKLPDHHEEGVEVPFERINPEALRNLIAEFVTREWEELGDSCHTLDDKIRQVQRQLQDKKARVVFDLTTNSCNIVLTP